MKITKLLTCIAALGLVFSLGACQTGDVIINVGDVDLSEDIEESESTQEGTSPSETTTGEENPSENPSEGPSEGGSSSSNNSDEGSEGGNASSEDTGSSYVPGASAISYEVKIVSENTSLTQYDSMTLEVELYMYEYKEGDPNPTLISTTKSSEVSDGVSLTVDNESIIGIEGLVISALEAGNANITAHWNVDESIYDSDPVEFTVSEYIPTYTYEAKITSDLSEIEIGEHLVEVYLYTYADGEIVNPDGVKATESDVTLTSGDSSIIETTDGSLIVNALATGETTLTATWVGHVDATDTITITVVSSGDTGGTTPEPEPEPEPEPVDVYTYEVKIENKDAYTSVLAGYEHEEEDIPALQIGLYTYKNSEQESVVYPTSTSEVEDLVVSSSNSDLVDIKEDLTLDIKVDTELTDPVTISATWTGHYVDENESTIASDSVDVYISYTPYPVYIETIAFTQSEYVLYYGGNEGDSSTTVGVTYSPETVDDNSYSISVENSSVATFDPETSTLTAVGVGETTMTVSATYGGASGSATVKVIEGKTDLTSISLSQSSYTLAYNEGYGSFTIGVGDTTADIKVTLNPENPDYKQLSVTNDDGYLSVDETTTNLFVISVTDEAKEVLKDSSITTDLSIASTYYSDVEPQTLTVTIQQTPAEITHPVEGILLDGTSVNKTDTGYQTSVLYNGTLTLGTTGKDINVSILPENAYSTAWSAEVSDNDSSKSYISLDGDSENGYTIAPINGEVLTEDTEATVIITSEGNGSDGNKLSVELTITIIHQDSYPTSLTITEYNPSVNLTSNTTETISVSYLVKDQRDNEMEGLELSATVDNDTDNTEVSIAPTTTAGEFTISAGSVEGSATISFYLTDYPDIKASETITVIVTDQYHAITAVSYSGGDQTINVEQTEEGINYGSFTVTSEMVSFSNATNDVDPSDKEKGFYLYTDSEYVTIEGNTITATSYSKTEDLTATIYIYSVANTSATPASFTATIHDATDYTPTGVDITQTGEGITLVEGSSVYFESYYSVSVVPSYADGSYIVASSDSKLTVEKDGDYYKISAVSDAVGAAEESTSASIIVYPTVDGDDTYISQAETIDVTITPVLPSTISTYTVNFTFSDDLPEYAALSIEGTLNSEAISANLIGSDSNYSLTLTDVTPDATLTYSISIDYDRNTYSDAPTSAKTAIVTGGSATLSLHSNGLTKGDYTSDSLTISTGVSLSDVLLDPTVTMKNNITVNFYFTSEDGSGNYKVPDYAKAYVAGYLTNGTYAENESNTWTSPDEASSGLTENGTEGSYYYSYTFSEIHNGNVTFQIYFEYETDITGSGFADWGYQWDFDYTIDKYTVKDGDTLNININKGDPATCIPERQEGDGTTEFYVVVFDNDSANSSSFSSSLTMTSTSTACFNDDWSSSSICSTMPNSSPTWGQKYIYNATVGTASVGDTLAITISGTNVKFYVWDNYIPATDSGYVAIYYCSISQEGYQTDKAYTAWNAGWDTSHTSVADYISSVNAWM